IPFTLSTKIALAPSDSICSFVAARTSVAETCAPRRRAVAIAWSPATPTPIMKARAAEIVPAAVIIIGKARQCRRRGCGRSGDDPRRQDRGIQECAIAAGGRYIGAI